MARVAGVSTATVSRVVHGQDRVRPSTRLRVQEVIEALRYIPDGAAQSLSLRRKEVIGLVSVERPAPESDVEQTNLLFVDEVLRGVEASLRTLGWSLLISFLQPGDPVYKRLLAMSGKIDGLLITEGGIVDAQQLAHLSARLPIVIVAGSPHEKGVDVVAADNRSGTTALVAHLVEVHGHRNLFYVSGSIEAPDAGERRLAFEQAVGAYRDATISGFFQGRFSSESGREAASWLVRSESRLPDAVVCGNDQMAIGVIRELAARGIEVPNQVAVVGFDDIYGGSLLAPPLTTVRQPMRLLGEQACFRLLQRIKDPALSRKVELLATQLVVRASCGCGNTGPSRLP